MAKRQLSVLLLPGDHIGPEVTEQAEKVLRAVCSTQEIDLNISTDLIGGASYEACGVPLADSVIDKARSVDAVLLGAVGGPEWEQLPREHRPEQGLLKIRSELELFANLRPSFSLKGLENTSPLRDLESLDLLVVRELVGDVYFAKPRSLTTQADGQRVGLNTMTYNESEVERIARVAFESAQGRNGKVTSIDKANVLEVSELWRTVVSEVAEDYPKVQLNHMYVDNAAMQMVLNPGQFDVVLAPNLFGDILSDLASVLPGSIGVLPSASLAESTDSVSLYEPCHGSAPDIAGQGKANPLAAIFSVAMLLEYAAGDVKAAQAVTRAAQQSIADGLCTADLGGNLSTSEVGDAVVKGLQNAR